MSSFELLELSNPVFFSIKKEFGPKGLIQAIDFINEAYRQKTVNEIDSELVSNWLKIRIDRAEKLLPFFQPLFLEHRKLWKRSSTLKKTYCEDNFTYLEDNQHLTDTYLEDNQHLTDTSFEDLTPSNPCGSIKDKSKNGSPSEKKKKNNYLLPVPNDFQITERIERWATENSFTLPEINAELPQFVDYHRAKGSTFKDWEAAFYTWMRNSRKFVRPDQKSTKPAIGSNEWHEDHPMKNWRQNPIFAGGI